MNDVQISESLENNITYKNRKTYINKLGIGREGRDQHLSMLQMYKSQQSEDTDQKN